MALKSIVLGPGECVTFPKDAVIKSVLVNGSISATSTCGTLPTPTAYKCGVFYVFVAVTSGDLGPLDEENTFYISLKTGTNTYTINEKIVQGDNPGTLTAIGTLNLHITDIALFEFKAVTRTVLGDRQRVGIYFKVPEDLWDSTVLKVSDRGTFYNLDPNETECDVYPDPS